MQSAIRAHFTKAEWGELANSLGVTLKSIQYQLAPNSPREVTFHFIGLLAVYYPAALRKIWMNYINMEATK